MLTEKEFQNFKSDFDKFKKMTYDALNNIERENFSQALQYLIFTRLDKIEKQLTEMNK